MAGNFIDITLEPTSKLYVPETITVAIANIARIDPVDHNVPNGKEPERYQILFNKGPDMIVSKAVYKKVHAAIMSAKTSTARRTTKKIGEE